MELTGKIVKKQCNECSAYMRADERICNECGRNQNNPKILHPLLIRIIRLIFSSGERLDYKVLYQIEELRKIIPHIKDTQLYYLDYLFSHPLSPRSMLYPDCCERTFTVNFGIWKCCKSGTTCGRSACSMCPKCKRKKQKEQHRKQRQKLRQKVFRQLQGEEDDTELNFYMGDLCPIL